MSVSVEKAKRPRKPNFSPSESILILQMAEGNLDVIRDKFSNVLTNKKKAEVWQSIRDKVNALGVAKRTTSEIKDKWRTMVTAAKKDFSRERREQRKTGGGKAPIAAKETSRRIIELFADEPSFSGIPGGIESGRQLFPCLVVCNSNTVILPNSKQYLLTKLVKICINTTSNTTMYKGV
jgi:hypothetical protein